MRPTPKAGTSHTPVRSRRILLVTHDFPPHVSPRAQRWGSLVRWLRARGHVVTVVTAHHSRASPGNEPGVLRIRRGLLDREATGEPSDRASKLLARAYQGTVRGLLWPDYAGMWARRAARRCLQLLKKDRFDLLVTVAHPFSSHWVGLRIRKRHRSLPWIADTGDPFSFLDASPPNRYALYRGRNKRAEAKVLREAFAVPVPSEELAQAYQDRFGSVAATLRVVGPMIPDRPTATVPPTKARRRLVFVGTLYAGLRDPRPFARAFAHANRDLAEPWDLCFVGQTGPYATILEQSLPDAVQVVGAVSPSKAWGWMTSADALLSLGNRVPYLLPSKIVEYLATDRPILHAPGAPGDATMRVLDGQPSAVVLSDDPSRWSDPVADFLRKPPPPRQRPSILQRFGVDAIGRRYEGLFP